MANNPHGQNGPYKCSIPSLLNPTLDSTTFLPNMSSPHQSHHNHRSSTVNGLTVSERHPSKPNHSQHIFSSSRAHNKTNPGRRHVPVSEAYRTPPRGIFPPDIAPIDTELRPEHAHAENFGGSNHGRQGDTDKDYRGVNGVPANVNFPSQRSGSSHFSPPVPQLPSRRDYNIEESPNSTAASPHTGRYINFPLIVNPQPYPPPSSSLTKKKVPEAPPVKTCFSCGVTHTVLWRRSKLHPGKHLCNACGLWERSNRVARTIPAEGSHLSRTTRFIVQPPYTSEGYSLN
ncbi:hypothetical protein GYMLUDRAFT_498252 [Collybiopsis luxurians FD-317 M1]|uniref:GATA-type domain-containing protein n=1 Tax=Collybiopsis luxurians FD-317 M1 TaxID=944289 RepID=A0A0D0CIA5_9AGAR|nr:hypothetical protein GYMLUDRAFT_498252 [Collybiopsis luxurians FD-317 M1]